MTQQPFIFPRLICFAFALLTVLGSPAVAGELHGLSAPDSIEGKFIVVLNEDAPSAFGRIRDIGQEEVRELSKTMADEFELRTEWVYGVAAKGFSASMSEEKARRLSKA